MVTQSQIDAFHEDWYLVLDDALTDADLSPVREEYSRLVEERAGRLRDERRIDETHAGAPFGSRLALLASEAPDIARNLDIMQVRGPATYQFLRNRSLLDVVGPEIVCNPI